MTDWDFLLTPLLVLPIVLLFRFVGCGLTIVGQLQPAPATPPPEPPKPSLPPPSNPIPTVPIEPPPKYPPYRDYILGDPHVGDVKHPGVTPVKADVIGYWRLVDLEPPTVAADETGFQPGTYEKSYALPATGDSKGKPSPAFGSPEPGLIVTDTIAKCRLFDGGHVKVPFKTDLYSDNFTIEAWIKADAFDAGFEYVLFDARGRYALPGMAVATRGFRVFVSQQQGWQVQLAPSNANLFQPAPLVSLPAPRTHVALTVGPPDGGGEKPVNFYVDGKLVAGPVKVTAYNRPDGVAALLLIGVENIQENPAQTPQYRHPVLCRIQEVVLHKKALSQQEIENHVYINQP